LSFKDSSEAAPQTWLRGKVIRMPRSRAEAWLAASLNETAPPTPRFRENENLIWLQHVLSFKDSNEAPPQTDQSVRLIGWL